MKFESKAVHFAERKRGNGCVPSTTPIHTATTYVYDSMEALDRIFGGEEEGQSYGRYDNPTRNALEAARFKHAARLTADAQREWSRDELMRIDAADLVIEGLDSADIARNMTKIPLEQSGPRRSYTGAQSGQGPS